MAKVTLKGKKVTGTNKKDKITWQNKNAWQKALSVFANGGNDVINFAKSKYNNKIYGGKGDDTISAGKGYNTVYFNKGDGKDTVLNGGGVDTLVFSKETKKTLKAKISGKNIVLTGKNGKNTVILKNYMNGSHSAQYVIIGKKKVKTETLLAVKKINSASKSIKGTQLRDKITSSADNAVINSLGGDDTITVSGDNFTINTGKGDDVINLTGKAKGTVIVNSGNGNLVINGIANAVQNVTQPLTEYGVILKSEDVLQNFHNKYYIAREYNGNDMIIYLNSGEKVTLSNVAAIEGMDILKTVGVYCNPDYLLDMIIRSSNDPLTSQILLLSIQTGIIPAELLAVSPPNIIDMGNKTYISVNQENTYLSATGNLERTIDFNSQLGVLYLDGTGTYNVNILSDSEGVNGEFWGNNNINIDSNMNFFTFHDGSVNNINISNSLMSTLIFEPNSNNTVTLSSETNSVGLSFYGNDNVVYSLGGQDNRISFQSEDLSKQSVIHSSGDHDFIYNSSSLLIDLTGNNNTNIEQVYINNDFAQTEIIGVDKAKTTIVQYYSDAAEFVYSHYYNQNANSSVAGDDFITLMAFDKNGTLSTGGTKIWGKWAKDNTNNIRFNLESMTKDNFTVHVNGGTFFALSNLAQYIDMSNIQNAGTLNFDNSGDILNMANKFHVKGTTNNDTYTISNLNKTYIISENGGSDDTLIINQDKSDFIFFFDVNTNGNFGNDLYIISTVGGDSSEFSKFIKNKDANYIRIENNQRLSSAEIDHIRTNTQFVDSLGFIFDIKQSVANWLNAYNTNQSKNYASVMEAIKDGKGSDSLIALYTTNAATAWNNRWDNLT